MSHGGKVSHFSRQSWNFYTGKWPYIAKFSTVQVQHHKTFTPEYKCTVWHKILMEGNIDEFDKFLSIHQHFSHQNFLLIIFCRLPACQTTFSHRTLSLVYAPMQFSFPCPQLSICRTEMSQFPVTSYLFHWLLLL